MPIQHINLRFTSADFADLLARAHKAGQQGNAYVLAALGFPDQPDYRPEWDYDPAMPQVRPTLSAPAEIMDAIRVAAKAAGQTRTAYIRAKLGYQAMPRGGKRAWRVYPRKLCEICGKKATWAVSNRLRCEACKEK